MAALRELVVLDIPATSGRWEVFGTPEYKGGVPGPTDMETLVAELTPSSMAWLQAYPQAAGAISTAPETVRPWFSANSRSMLASRTHCREYHATLKKTGKPVEGFACISDGQVFLYLTLIRWTN